jgi:hypothetical protein
VVVPALKGFKHNHAAQALAHLNHNVLLIQVADRKVLHAMMEFKTKVKRE